jgi:hypothetical protein
MAKREKKPKKNGGPYLAAACFCERTIEDKSDSALSAIRLIDQITISLPAGLPIDFPSEENRISVPVSSLLVFKTGDAPGEHNIRVVMVSPSGKESPPFEQKFIFPAGENSGINITATNKFMVVKGGLFWLDVYLDGKQVTRMPIRILVEREPQPPEPGATSTKPVVKS